MFLYLSIATNFLFAVAKVQRKRISHKNALERKKVTTRLELLSVRRLLKVSLYFFSSLTYYSNSIKVLIFFAFYLNTIFTCCIPSSINGSDMTFSPHFS